MRITLASLLYRLEERKGRGDKGGRAGKERHADEEKGRNGDRETRRLNHKPKRKSKGYHNLRVTLSCFQRVAWGLDELGIEIHGVGKWLVEFTFLGSSNSLDYLSLKSYSSCHLHYFQLDSDETEKSPKTSCHSLWNSIGGPLWA
jgi:hypothetical protein